MVSRSEKYDNLFTKLALIPLAIRNPVLGRIASNKIRADACWQDVNCDSGSAYSAHDAGYGSTGKGIWATGGP